MDAERSLEAAIAALAPIGLDELNGNAALMTRTDRKYLLLSDALTGLLGGSGARALSIAGRRAMTYESVYFDTPERVSHLGAAHGRRRRFKVRTRHYADTGQRYLEVKTRGVRGLTVKRRIPYEAEDPTRIDRVGEAFVSEQLRGGNITGVDVRRLRAALRTTYLRSTLLLPDGSTRVTVDQALTWSDADNAVSAGPLIVVETKTATGTPSAADRVLWSAGHRPVRLSKYGTGMRLLDPRLPGNRWARVIAAGQRCGFTPVTRAPVAVAAAAGAAEADLPQTHTSPGPSLTDPGSRA